MEQGARSQRSKKAGISFDGAILRYICTSSDNDVISIEDSFTVTVAGQSPNTFSKAVAGLDYEKAFEGIRAKATDVSVPLGIALTDDNCFVQTVRMPGLSPDEARPAFRYEFERYFPIKLKDACYDMAEIFYPLKNGGEETRYYIAAARKSLLKVICGAAVSQGLSLETAEPERTAVERVFDVITGERRAAVFLRVGAKISQLFLFWKGNGIFTKNIGCDTSELLSVEEKREKFAKEVAYLLNLGCMRTDGFAPVTVYIASAAELFPFLREIFIPLGIYDCNHFEPFKNCKSSSPLGFEWHVPFGLSLRR